MSQHADGKAARKVINESRSEIYSSFHTSEKEFQLLFHSGATEAMASFAYSFSEKARLEGKNLLICYSSIDHPAVVSLTQKFYGSHVKFYELDIDQELSYLHQKNFTALKDKKDNDPELMILYHHLWVHNETGLVSKLSELEVFKTIPDLYIHVDGVQAPGKIKEWNKLLIADMFTFSPHKFGALKGIGFSFVKAGLVIHSLITGGGQQQGLRGGTENTLGIHSIAYALRDLQKSDISQTFQLRDDLSRFLQNELQGFGALLYSSAEKLNSNTIYFYLHELSSDISLALFDLNGLMISAGSACSSGAARPSAVLLKSGHAKYAKNGLRLSLGFFTTAEELATIKTRLKNILTKIRTPWS